MRLAGILSLALLLSACTGYDLPPILGAIPPFSLTDQTGRTFNSEERLKGKVWVANFIFTNCSGPCPRMSSQMRQVRDAAKSGDVRFVSFTIDPARDTPPVLANYAKRYGANPERWYFLTGTQAELHQLKRHAFMLGDVDGSLQHSTRFVLVDRNSQIRGFYDTSEAAEITKLARDLDRLSG